MDKAISNSAYGLVVSCLSFLLKCLELEDLWSVKGSSKVQMAGKLTNEAATLCEKLTENRHRRKSGMHIATERRH
jgi:hypothetical protein